jgi:hypothetical protein
MPRAVLFYQALGYALKSGGRAARFTSFRAGSGYLNLVVMPLSQMERVGPYDLLR